MIAQMSYFDGLSLREQMEEQISSLTYPALQRLVVLLLRSMGYRDVRIVDGGRPRGYSRFGGMSMIARSPGPIQSSQTLIQVKQIALQRRYVDELRGAMQRWGSGQGIIITTGSIAEKSRFCADLFPGRPVRLISRSQLAKLLIDKNLGVRTAPLPAGSSNDLLVDELFFELLAESKQRQ